MRRGSDSGSFEKPAEAYDRFVGRYGRSLAHALIERVRLPPASRVLDVGCGPGQLTAVLAEAVGEANVSAVDPSESFAAACRARIPGSDVRVASAEELPFGENSFDATLSQLVLNFIPDPAAGLREMMRVTRPGGTVAACVWDYAGEMTMLRAFWDAAIEVDAGRAEALDEGRRMRNCDPDSLGGLWAEAGLEHVTTDAIIASAAYGSFDELWEPFTAGVGPAGAYCASVSEQQRDAIKTSFHARLGSPEAGFELSARAWMASGTVPDTRV